MRTADLSILPASVKPEEASGYLAHVAHITGSDLPIIVDEAGEYITRDGCSVFIDKIDDPEKSSFNCKGYLHKPKKTIKGEKIVRSYNIWSATGRFVALGESKIDITRKVLS